VLTVAVPNAALQWPIQTGFRISSG
jgi:hypothetical protein